MPKSRNYAEMGQPGSSDNGAPGVRRGPQHLQTVQAPRSSEVLLALSNACNKHAIFHKNSKSHAVARPDEVEENLPEKCSKDLASLRSLLPKVEKAFKATTNGQKGGPEALDVSHLCAFYHSVLNGAYCPHAPHLFSWGKGAVEGELYS
jgi:hypothetical protein